MPLRRDPRSGTPATMSKLVPLSPGGDEEADLQVLPVSQVDLAAISCVSRNTVNTALRKLIARGIFRLGCRRILVLQRRTLDALPRMEARS